MILASSSLSRPGLTSTWTPRSLKIATAAGESLSEIRTRGVMKLVRNGGHDSRESDRESRLSVSCRESGHPAQGRRRRLWTPAFAGVTKSESGSLGEFALLEHERVIEPVRQRLDIGRFDRRAAPDAQASRRVAISADVKRDLFFLKQGRQTLGECGLGVGRQSGHRRIDDFKTDAGVRACLGRAGEEIDPRRAVDPICARFGVSVGAGKKRLQAAERLRPVQGVEIVLNAQHGGGVDGLALKKAFGELAARGETEKLRQRPGRRVGLEAFGRTRAQDDDAMRPLAPENLLPGERHDIELRPIELLGKGRRCGVADRQPFAVAGDPIAVRHANAGGSAIPGENDVVVEIDLRQVRQFAVWRFECADVLELELLDDVGHPALAKAFPGENIDAARAEKRPERHLDGAGVGAWGYPDAIVGGNAQHFAGEVDRQLKLGFADLRPMRTAKRRVIQSCRGPAGALDAWAARETRIRGPNARRLGRNNEPSFQMEASRWGEVSRCGSYRNCRPRASGVRRTLGCGRMPSFLVHGERMDHVLGADPFVELLARDIAKL